MKKTTSLLSLAILFAMSFILTSSVNTPTKYVFDAAASKVTSTSTAEDGKTHTGALDFKSGTLMFDVKTLQSGFSYINMQSLTCKDITDAGFNRELITEMRSESELDVVKFKETTFKIVKAKRLDVVEGQPNYDVDALLKLKGLPEDSEVITVPGSPTSPQQLKDWLFELGWEPKTFKLNAKEEKIPQVSLAFGGGLCPSVKELFEKDEFLEELGGLYRARHRFGLFKSFLERL